MHIYFVNVDGAMNNETKWKALSLTLEMHDSSQSCTAVVGNSVAT
jgi:hypothetical protein